MSLLWLLQFLDVLKQQPKKTKNLETLNNSKQILQFNLFTAVTKAFSDKSI